MRPTRKADLLIYYRQQLAVLREHADEQSVAADRLTLQRLDRRVQGMDLVLAKLGYNRPEDDAVLSILANP